jgi:hypothetical protein
LILIICENHHLTHTWKKLFDDRACLGNPNWLNAPLFIFKCQNHPRIERVSIYTLVSVTLLEHLSSPPVFCEVRFTRSLVLCACFVYICPFVLFHCVVCSSSIYGFLITPLISSIASYLLFDDSSNGVVYFDFHFMTVRTVLYIILFIF